VIDETASPAGVDVPNVTRWLSDLAPDLEAPLSFTRSSVGRSNLTYVVSDQGNRRWVLRRPPLSGLLPSAHDMAREHRIISALASAGFRVPGTIGFCDDPAVLGADFYVMEFVGGHTVEKAPDAEHIPLPNRQSAGLDLMDTLAELHNLDVDEAGLGDLARRDGYFERQLKRWNGQWQAARARDIPAAQEAHDLLAELVPLQQRVSVVHGDFRIDNVRMATDGRVLAVLDWELCTLGDPLADLGTCMSAWQEPGEPAGPLFDSPSRSPGFPTRAEMIGRYADSSNLDVTSVDYYIAFSFWKLALIMEGVYMRNAGGAYGEVDPATVQQYADQAVHLAETSLEHIHVFADQ
jgi:aminoglycoside phosphotransferase (APT) family kinase protein